MGSSSPRRRTTSSPSWSICMHRPTTMISTRAAKAGTRAFRVSLRMYLCSFFMGGRLRAGSGDRLRAIVMHHP